MFGRAIVLGGGMAGIASAAALAPHCAEVLLVERDALGCDSSPRKGSPQGNHLHNLLSRAQRHLEELLPGFRSALMAAGGTVADVATQTYVHEAGTRMPSRPLGLQLWSAPLPVVEQVARGLLPADTVRIVDRATAVGLHTETGELLRVELERDGAIWVAGAELVVDAMGPGTPLPQWLARIDEPVPAVQERATRQWYATMVVRRPVPHLARPDFWLVFPTPPRTRAGLVSPAGSDSWTVSLSGCDGDIPPRDVDEFRIYAGTLEDPVIADLLADAVPLAQPVLFRRPVAKWRRYDMLERPLPGLLVVGEALATLNPLLGQGISVAAWQAAELMALLSQAPDPAGLSARFAQRAANVCAAAWGVQALSEPGEDDRLRFSEHEWRVVANEVHQDREAHRRYVGVWHLLEPLDVLEELAGHGARQMGAHP